MGFKVKLGANARKRKGFLAGTDRERAGDVMSAFKDGKVHGIVCLRGGYGTPRVLPLLDYRLIQKNPKIFIGYSDITALHCALLKRSNLTTFHGPTPAAAFTEKDYPSFSRNSWLTSLMSAEPFGSILKGYENKTVKRIRKGKATGELLGGNLSLLCSLVGTPYLPTFKNKILFFEDIDEKPYRLDRMLTHLLNAGLLQQASGIAIGLCHACEDPKAATAGEFRQSTMDVFKERLGSLDVPIVVGLPFGHVPFNATIPMGIKALLDADKGDLLVMQPAVL